MVRTDFEPLTWEEAEENRQENPTGTLVAPHHEEAQGYGVFPELAAVLAGTSSQSEMQEGAAKPRLASTAERYERLRGEIKRGREYLEQAQRDLAESRSQLEDWPAYEQTCGKNPLACLTQSVLVKTHLVRFLSAWLKRRETELDSMVRSSHVQAA